MKSGPSNVSHTPGMIWKMAHACDVHEVMTYDIRVQAQRSAIQPRKQQGELRFSNVVP